MIRNITLAILILLVSGFQQGTRLTEEEIIARGVQIKIDDFRNRQIRICRDKAVQAAVVRVDSLIRARARFEAVEPKIKPPKPQRPQKPEVKVIPDSLDHDSLRIRKN